MSKKSERSETEPLLEDLEEERMPKVVRGECNLLAFITRRLEEFRSNFLKDYIPEETTEPKPKQILEEIASNLFGGDDIFTRDAIKFVVGLCAGIYAVELKGKYGLELCGKKRGGASNIGVRCYNSQIFNIPFLPSPVDGYWLQIRFDEFESHRGTMQSVRVARVAPVEENLQLDKIIKLKLPVSVESLLTMWRTKLSIVLPELEELKEKLVARDDEIKQYALRLAAATAGTKPRARVHTVGPYSQRHSGDVIVVDIGTRWDGVNCDGISQEYQMRAERKEGLAASLPGVVKTRELFCCCPACFAKDYDHCSFPTETSPFVLHVWSFGVRPPPKQRRPRAAGVAGVVLDLGVGAGAGGAAGIGAIPVVGGGGAAGMGAPPIIGGRGTGGERVDVLVDGGVEGGVGVRGAPAIVPQREAGVAPGGAGGGDPEFAVAAVDGEGSNPLQSQFAIGFSVLFESARNGEGLQTATYHPITLVVLSAKTTIGTTGLMIVMLTRKYMIWSRRHWMETLKIDFRNFFIYIYNLCAKATHKI